MKNTRVTDPSRLRRLLSRFADVPVLIVGDLMVDRMLRGAAERISPEAPVPVVRIHEEHRTAGGAGNVVFNLRALGARPTLVAVRSNDEEGRFLETEFRGRSLSTMGLVLSRDGRPTACKTRVVAGQQQIVRFDIEKTAPLSPQTSAEVIERIRALLPKNRIVVISDYGKGVVTRETIQATLRLAHRQGKAVIVDPKMEHFMLYRGVDCITPNTKEAVEGMRALPPKTDEDWVSLGRRIQRRLRCRSVLLTRGEKGMLVVGAEGRSRFVATEARQVFDVTGAGDTVVSVFALCRAAGAGVADAATLANMAAGIVVGKFGTATVTPEELAHALGRR